MAGSVIDHITHPEWPNSFDSDATGQPLYVVRSSGDTAAYMMSHAHDGIGLSAPQIGAPGDIRYLFNQPIRATMLSMFVMGGLTFQMDSLQGLVAMTTTFTGTTDSLVRIMNVGTEIRNWTDGSLNCGGQREYFIAKPTDPLAAQVYAGPGSSGPPNVFYDYQEVQLPPSERSHSVTSLRIQAMQIPNCSYYSTSGVFGLALTPSFTVSNRSGQPVTPLTQTNAEWATNPYGGFVYNGVLYNGESMIDSLGCELTCLAMVDRYFGGTATPTTINAFLQNAPYTYNLLGYIPTEAFFVDSVGGTGVGDHIRCEWRLPHEAPPTSGVWAIQKNLTTIQNVPIGVVSVESAVDTTLRCRITSLFRTWPLDTALFGLVYRDIFWVVASRFFSDPTHTGTTPRWDATLTPYESVGVPLIEQALSDSLPVLLSVNDDSHWVLATGMTPYWVPGNPARGTYGVADPLFAQTSLYPAFDNGFRDAITVDRYQPVPRAPAVGGGGSLLAMVLVGDAHAYVRGPAGGEVSYDEVSDSYVSTLAGATALRGLRLNQSTPPHDIIVIDQPAVGSYQLDLVSESSGRATATLTAVDPQGTSTITSCDAVLNLGTESGYLLNDNAGQLTTTSLGVTDVATHAPAAVAGLQIVPNPARGAPRILLTLPDAADGKIEVFDVTGRRLEVLFAGHSKAGTHELMLSGGGGLNPLRRPGLYFVRASFGTWTKTTRIVSLEGQ